MNLSQPTKILSVMVIVLYSSLSTIVYLNAFQASDGCFSADQLNGLRKLRTVCLTGNRYTNRHEQLFAFMACFFLNVQKETGHKGKKLFMPIRVAVTGQTHGPELPQAIELIGRETAVRRLKSI